MSNQQVAKIIYYFRFLRDYTRRVFQIERLKYSPTNSKNINLYLNNLKTLFKDKLINVRLIKLYNLIFYNNNYLSTKINILPIQKIHKEDYTTDTINYYSNKINPNWITGFVDAEGCFSVIIEISDITKWRVRTSFEINLHIKDVGILYKIQSFFGVGAVYLRAYKNIAVYRVSNIEYLRNIIIPHFNKYPLITQKYTDFYLWSKVIIIILNKEHLNKSGFLTILTYYASINKGMSQTLLIYFPNIVPVLRPAIILPTVLNPFW